MRGPLGSDKTQGLLSINCCAKEGIMKIIKKDIFDMLRNGVCAIGFLTEPLKTYLNNLESEIFQVIGTGFLVDEQTVMTNRHVIGGLIEAQITHVVPHTQLFIQFVAPKEDGTPFPVPRMIRQVSYLDDPGLDIGLIRFRIFDESHFEVIKPLPIAEEWNLSVSEEVGVCGYPYGTYMLTRGVEFRWGPVLQQGHISAVSPFDTFDTPDEILLDVRTAEGMSGAPIFRPFNGEVIGVHYAGIEATTAFGIPINKDSVESSLSDFNLNRIEIN